LGAQNEEDARTVVLHALAVMKVLMALDVAKTTRRTKMYVIGALRM
jgi:hypothetical protein